MLYANSSLLSRSFYRTNAQMCLHDTHTHTASSFLIAFASNSSSLYRCASLLASLVLRVTLLVQFSDLMREHGCMSEIRATWIKRISHNNICIFCAHLYATLLPFRLLLLFISIAITIPFFFLFAIIRTVFFCCRTYVVRFSIRIYRVECKWYVLYAFQITHERS